MLVFYYEWWPLGLYPTFNKSSISIQKKISAEHTYNICETLFITVYQSRHLSYLESNTYPTLLCTSTVIRTKCTSTVIRTKEYCVIIYYTYVLAALLIAYFKSYLNMASEFFQFSTTLIDTGLHNIINQNRILLYPSFLGIDRGNLNLMVANYFIGTSFKYNKTSRWGSFVYGTNIFHLTHFVIVST